METENADNLAPDRKAGPRQADNPLKGLSHLADGLEPSPFQLDEYEEVRFYSKINNFK
jgi:hypothetical protein